VLAGLLNTSSDPRPAPAPAPAPAATSAAPASGHAHGRVELTPRDDPGRFALHVLFAKYEDRAV